jgi:hypothetical protein
MSGMTVTTPPPSLETELVGVAGHLNTQHANLVEITTRALADDGWVGHGIHSPARWLTIQMGLSPSPAQLVVAIAERIDEFPVLRETFSRGELSIEQVHTITAKAPAWADARVTEFARYATVRQLRRVIRDEYFTPDPDEPEPEPTPERDRVSFGWDEHGRFSLHANGPADRGVTVEAALNEARDALFRSGDETVTWWDALEEVCGRSLTTTPLERRERFKTYLHIHTDRDVTQLTNGVLLPDSIRDYLLCDSAVQPVWERDNTPIGVGRTQRAVPDRTRRIIEHRDQGCRVPGCGRRHVETHHIIHWSNGGVTETWNLISLCSRHHRLHHQAVLEITGNADEDDGVVFTDTHGSVLPNHPTPTPPSGPPPEPDRVYRHPTGERLDARWIDFIHPNALKRRHQQARRSCQRRAETDRQQRLRDHQAWYDHNSP